MNTYRFRCANGDIAETQAETEQEARASVMEQRWGPPELNKTWACTAWQGLGLVPVDKWGMVL